MKSDTRRRMSDAAAPDIHDRAKSDTGAGANVRGDRDGHSRIRVAQPAPTSWASLRGWATTPKRRSAWHHWRHGRSLCGAYEWLRHWGPPRLLEQPETGRYGKACARCVARAAARPRHFWRDHERKIERPSHATD